MQHDWGYVEVWRFEAAAAAACASGVQKAPYLVDSNVLAVPRRGGRFIQTIEGELPTKRVEWFH